MITNKLIFIRTIIIGILNTLIIITTTLIVPNSPMFGKYPIIDFIVLIFGYTLFMFGMIIIILGLLLSIQLRRLSK